MILALQPAIPPLYLVRLLIVRRVSCPSLHSTHALLMILPYKLSAIALNMRSIRRKLAFILLTVLVGLPPQPFVRTSSTASVDLEHIRLQPFHATCRLHGCVAGGEGRICPRR